MRISDWSSDVCSSDLQIDGVAAEAWLHAQRLSLAGMGNVRLLRRCSAFGYYDHNQIQAVQLQPVGDVRQRLLHIPAADGILATGASDRPRVYPHNTRPGSTPIARAAGRERRRK